MRDAFPVVRIGDVGCTAREVARPESKIRRVYMSYANTECPSLSRISRSQYISAIFLFALDR